MEEKDDWLEEHPWLAVNDSDVDETLRYSLDEIRNNPSCMNPDDGLNTLLAAAYYQPVNGKNILDVMTVFSSYVMYDY